MIYWFAQILYIYDAGRVPDATRNALNCINCPTLCKRRSSFRAPLWYFSSLSLIHSPTLLSCVPGAPFSLAHSRRPAPVSLALTRAPPSLSVRMTFTSLGSAKSFFSSRASRSVAAPPRRRAVRTSTARGAHLRKSHGKGRVYIHTGRT